MTSLPVEQDRARPRPEQAGDGVEHRGLAGAVGADQGDQRAGSAAVERHVAHGLRRGRRTTDRPSTTRTASACQARSPRAPSTVPPVSGASSVGAEVGLDHERVAGDVARVARGDHLAEVEHDDRGCTVSSTMPHVVLDEQHRDAVVGQRADEVRPARRASTWFMPGGRLVEDQQASGGRRAPGRSRAGAGRRRTAAPARASAPSGEADPRELRATPGRARAARPAGRGQPQQPAQERRAAEPWAPTSTFSSAVRRSNSLECWKVRLTPAWAKRCGAGVGR